MSKPTGNNHSTLSWVKKELDVTLRQAAEALEIYSEEPSDLTHLQFCGSHLHQVQGILQMLELFGAAMLVEEMEQVVAALLQGEVRQSADAQQVLMQSILQLEDYLERLQGGLRDAAILLLPLLNDLRAVRQASLLTEHALFSPDLTSVQGHRSRPPATGEPLAQAARRVRSQFQRGLLGLLREQDVPASLPRMREALDELDAATFDAAVGDQWWVASGLIEALEHEAVDNAAAIKTLLAQVDREIRRAAELGEADLVAEPREDLLKNLLYYIARADVSSERISAIQEHYGLKQLLLDEQQLAAGRGVATPNRETLQTVAAILKDDLTSAKDALDLFARSNYSEQERLPPLVNGLQQVADTLGVLGLSEPRRLIQQQMGRLESFIDGSAVADEAEIMGVAEALLQVEAAIEGFSSGASTEQSADGELEEASASQLPTSEYDGIYGIALDEAVAEIGRIKEAVSTAIDADSAAGGVEAAERLEGLAATLRMLEQAEAAQHLVTLSSHVTTYLAPGQPLPEQATLDALADVLAGVEYYLEAARDGGVVPPSVRSVIEAAFAQLAAGSVPTIEPAAELTAADAEPESEPSALGIAAAEQTDLPESSPAPAAPPAKQSGRVNYDVPVLADELDPDILEIFVEEAGEVLETVRGEYPRWRADADNSEALTTLRRMFHTLKGSGRLAGALLLGELAWCIESLLNRLLERSIVINPNIYAVVDDAISVLPALIEQIQGGPAPERDIAAIMQRAEALAYPEQTVVAESVESLAPAEAAHDAAEELQLEVAETSADAELLEADTVVDDSLAIIDAQQELDEPAADLEWVPQAEEVEPPEAAETPLAETEINFGELSIDFSDDAENEPEPEAAPVLELEQDDVPPAAAVAEPEVASGDMDPTLYDIFNRESADHLSVVDEFIARARAAQQAQAVDDALIRALHTLSGSARMADVAPIARIGRKLELLAENHVLAQQPMAAAELELLAQGADLVREMVQSLAEPDPQWPDIEPLLADIDAATAALAEIIEAAEAQRESAAPAPLASLAEIDIDLDLAALFLEEAEDILRFMEMTIDRWESELDHESNLAELHRSLHTLKGGARLAGFDPIAHLCHALESVAVDVAEEKLPADDAFFNMLHGCVDRLDTMVSEAQAGAAISVPQELLDAISALRGSEELAEIEPLGEVADAELVEAFLEEAAEILEATEVALTQWQDEPDNADRIIDLQRALHTLKGGARMAGFKPIADLSHALESLLVSVQAGEPPISLELFDLLERIYDRLYSLRTQAAAGEPLQTVEDLLADIAALRARPPVAMPEALAEVEAPVEPLPASATGEPVPAETTATLESVVELPSAAADSTSADLVRVRAELLDNMVNLAGEVSIYRARLEQQVGSMRFNLSELDQTVARLRDQLRTLEIETEAQILYRFDRDYEETEAAEDTEEFDPLELDRFSRMQELSRALSESTNDLLSIQSLLDNLTRESETLLLQQSRVNTELQDGLMRTRMVPFANLVPRMRRIVRQTCHELGKKAQLKVQGARGEMDRTVLERVTAPLEHMLRNAVAHGIEAPEARLAAGKEEEGEISVALSREGADVVIRVSDDGGGLHLESIRHKAVAQGLMPSDASLTDREVMQFILEAGFSTSEEVTQIAGRGVGLDVVASEIKQLGGTVEIDSNPSQGTTFTIRLPFTLAVNQALLCQVGEEAYAIPLTSVEGVVRMTHEELEHCFSHPEAAHYDYAGERYEVRGLSSLLGIGEPQLPGAGERSPIILVQTGDHRLAIQVDALLGSREIVVKSVGPQVSTVPGIYGATILADGRVVLILDISSLIRLHLTAATEPEVAPLVAAPNADGTKKVTVMVVDDSITMRKVATRLLERSGMAVVTAKDGVDAVARLQETVPDAMLLDIEMPRMDGYELATHMRNDEQLQHVPIIMITSRTSEKHRERAFEIGVNRYLGKPYQEAELLENLQEVLEESGVHI